ncbi:hypothetical protein AVEN_132878-1 [Araneus ventricosus]|uniref:CCHC-type domain-containing protein n=1 Tax=Araneus ventricosus TaxID=182803 RepID=A0A4Y2RME7_ARAVE|nr:hypothetical protein AVEN_132878-1 [Araneus ventricosus]
MRAHVASQVEGIKDHVDGCIGRMEEEVQGVKGKIEDVKTEVKEKMSHLERRLGDLETRPNNFPANPEFMYSRPTVKPLTFYGLTSWTVFKTQFDDVSSTNGWTDSMKASQLVASLRGSAAEVLQGIPDDKLTDLTTIEKALESRFGDSHLTQFYITELKTRSQKPGESLLELAADVERLMSLAYAECPQDVRESLAAQYFVGAIRVEDTQHSTRVMDIEDLKSSLTYSMKYEAARTVSKTTKHVRSIDTEDHMSRERDDKFEFFFNRLEKLLNSSVVGKKNTPRRNPNVTCWKCKKKGHVQSECQAITSNRENRPGEERDTDRRKEGEEIPLFSASAQHSKSCSVLAKKRTIIPARSECLIQGVLEVPGQIRYTATDFPSQVSQKGILVAATLVDLEREAIPVRVLNLNNKPKILDKGTVIATYEPVVDIVTYPQEFSGEQHLPSILGNLEILNEKQRREVRKLLKEFQNLFSTCDTDIGSCNMIQHKIHTGDHPPIKQYPRRLALAGKEEAERLVNEMVEKRNNRGIVRSLGFAYCAC